MGNNYGMDSPRVSRDLVVQNLIRMNSIVFSQYPGRCALNPPPCTQKTTKNESKSHHKSLKIGSGTILGALGEPRGPFWPQDGPRLKKGTKPPRKSSPFLAPKWRPGPTFRGLFFKCFLRCTCFRFFMILGAQDLFLASILALL